MNCCDLLKLLAVAGFVLLGSTSALEAGESDSARTADIIAFSGPARVVDGDTLIIGSQSVRIEGIDAPEDGQNCSRANGRQWACGAQATKLLRQLSARGVSCEGSEFDAYDRLIASCMADKADVGQTMVLNGMALAYRRFSKRYVAAEKIARVAHRGVWVGPFVVPWQWRKEKWQEAGTTASSPGCPIKGNISSNGDRIYHAPWSRSYNRTRVNEAKGERWFCDEAEAIAAGWRAPFR